MKTSDRRRFSPGRRFCLLLLLGIGFGVSGFIYPGELTATGGSAAVVKTVASGLEMVAVPASGTLKDFVQQTMDMLAKDAPFKSWKGAQSRLYPLGPGTHGWLVNVMNGEQRIGYLIIAANEEGGYILSEYGAGNEGLPYSLNDLRQTLVQAGLIPSDYSGTLELTPLYTPLQPLWEISINGKKVYINAADPEILPWTAGKAKAVLSETVVKAQLLPSLESLSPRAVYKSSNSFDPYENMLWLTKPKLPAIADDAFPTLMQRQRSLVFESSGQNESYGSPFTVTGYQLWVSGGGPSAAGTKGSTVQAYAATGPQGKRFLPLSVLQKSGALHETALPAGTAEI